MYNWEIQQIKCAPVSDEYFKTQVINFGENCNHCDLLKNMSIKVISLKFPKLNWPLPAQSRVLGHPAKFSGQPQWSADASATWQHHPWSCLPDCCYALLEATPGGLPVHQKSGQSW